jgi:hypothetical protein
LDAGEILLDRAGEDDRDRDGDRDDSGLAAAAAAASADAVAMPGESTDTGVSATEGPTLAGLASDGAGVTDGLRLRLAGERLFRLAPLRLPLRLRLLQVQIVKLKSCVGRTSFFYVDILRTEKLSLLPASTPCL